MRALETYLEKTRAFRKFAREDFIRDDSVHALAERYLHLAMEAVLDVGNHLIADRGLPVPDTFKGVFKTLADAGLLPDSLAAQLQL